MKLKIKPTSGYILIEPQESEKITSSGIVLPESHEEKPQRGKVLAIGADQITDFGIKKDSPCKVGDVVLYKQWGANEIKVEGKEYLLAKFDDILAIED